MRWSSKPGVAPIDDSTLLGALRSVQAHLGERTAGGGARPKRSLLALYFRKAAIDGMTDPFFLEIVVNPDLLPSERPFVIAHEWAHIAGFADESEANFIAWLTCLRRLPPRNTAAGWRPTSTSPSGLPPQDRRALAEALSPPVRADLIAERERFNRSSPAVRNAARGRLRHLPSREPHRRRDRQLQRGRPVDAGYVAGCRLESPSALKTRAQRLQTRILTGCGISAGDRADRGRHGPPGGGPAGSEIVGLHVRLGRDDLDGQPSPPSAVVAAIRLTIGQAVTQGFEETSQRDGKTRVESHDGHFIRDDRPRAS